MNIHSNQPLWFSTSCLSIGLQGVRDEDVQKVQETIKSVLKEVRETGFDSKRIEAAIHQMELSQKHVSWKARSFFETKNKITENCRFWTQYYAWYFI